MKELGRQLQGLYVLLLATALILLLYYCCFTAAALLLLYCSFTTALLHTCISGSVLCMEELGRRLQGFAVPHANSSEGVMSSVDTPTALPTCIRQHTLAYVSIRQHAPRELV